MDAFGDKDDPGAAVLVGPLAEVLRRMDDVLHAVEDDGSSLADVEEPFDTQHVLTPGVEQHAEPDPERRPVDGPVERDRDGVRVAHVVRIAGLRRKCWRVRSRAVRAKELGDVYLAEGSLEDPGRRVYRAQPRQQAPCDARLRYVRLGHDDLVGRRDLLERLRVAVQVQVSVDRVDRSEYQVHREVVLQDGIGEDRVEDGGGIRQAGRLDDDAIQPRYLALLVHVEESQEGSDEILPGGAAYAAAREQNRALVDPAQEVVVQTNLAELVDENGSVGHRRLREHPPQERRLAAAEEAGHDRHRPFGASSLHVSTRRAPRTAPPAGRDPGGPAAGPPASPRRARGRQDAG